MSYARSALKINDRGDCKNLLNLKGKTIVDVGFIQGCDIKGGLTFDYCDGNDTRRIGHNDLGTWIAWQGIKGKENAEDILKEKIKKSLEDKNGLMRYLWLKKSSKLAIIDDPLKRCYRFVIIGKKKKELLALTVVEIKLLSKQLSQYFTCKKEDRIAKMTEMMKTAQIPWVAPPASEHEFVKEFLDRLYDWAIF